MSSTTGTTSANMLALQKATDSAASSSAVTALNKSSSDSSSSTSGAFSSMASNENNFLTLLTTQLQHQDPTSPMKSTDTAAQIAQFSSVEQQVQTNTNLKSILSLQQTNQLTQSKASVGQTVSFSGSQLPLQSGKAGLTFSAGSGETIGISVADSTGKIVRHATTTSEGGTQSWTWDGKDDNGTQLSDGGYSVSVKSVDNAGNTSDVSFNPVGTITGVKRASDGSVNLVMSGANVPLSEVETMS